MSWCATHVNYGKRLNDVAVLVRMLGARFVLDAMRSCSIHGIYFELHLHGLYKQVPAAFCSSSLSCACTSILFGSGDGGNGPDKTEGL